LKDLFNSVDWKLFEHHLKIINKKEQTRLGGKIIKNYGQELLLGKQSISYLMKQNEDEFMKGFEEEEEEVSGGQWVFPQSKDDDEMENTSNDKAAELNIEVALQVVSNKKELFSGSSHNSRKNSSISHDAEVQNESNSCSNGDKRSQQSDPPFKNEGSYKSDSPHSSPNSQVRSLFTHKPIGKRKVMMLSDDVDSYLEPMDPSIQPGSPVAAPYKKRKLSQN